MSLSEVIIYGSKEQLTLALQEQPEIDEIDEYGYTPLIQTAIIDDMEKAKLIIDAGADINFTDLTGRSALHWTTDNNNIDFSELLLKHKADPNAYMRAGQPVLVMPFLRKHEEMKKLLLDHGARLYFAQDFINAKLLGHRFELEGRIDIVDTQNTFIEMEFEGFYLEFNLAIVANSLMDFFRNFGGKHLKDYFPVLQLIIQSLRFAGELSGYQHYLTKIEKYESRIDTILNQTPLVIPIACNGHAINFIRYNNLLIRCDRGVFGREHGAIIVYKMRHPQKLNNAFIKELLYKRQTQQFIDQLLPKQLDLERIIDIPIATQLTGNCSWANVEAIIPAMLFLFFLGQKDKDSSMNIDACKQQSLYVYEEWIHWDKNRALHFCIESFYQTDDPARKAAKAATLASILFQRLNYEDKTFYQKAEKIASILVIPKFDYILKTYLTVFSKAKKNERFKQLCNFLDDMGVNVNEYIR